MIKLFMIKKLFSFISIIIVIVISPFIGSFFSQKHYTEMDQEIKSSVFDAYDEKNLLVFFGYVGCIDICTPRLNEISSVYKKLKKENIDVGVVFINTSKLQDSELSELFAKSFHKDFKGVYLEGEALNNLKKEFKVYSAPSFSKPDEIDHTSFLYLLKKVKSKYYLKIIYTSVPLDHCVSSKEFID